MKKVFAMLLSVMLVAVMTVSAFAATEKIADLSDAVVVEGNTVTVTVPKGKTYGYSDISMELEFAPWSVDGSNDAVGMDVVDVTGLTDEECEELKATGQVILWTTPEEIISGETKTFTFDEDTAFIIYELDGSNSRKTQVPYIGECSYYGVKGSYGVVVKAGSPKTFDAGVTLFVGMAIAAAAGSAVVIGKKKDF